eukprot:COSAG06_NODE_8581_length_2124_cov_1.919506_3_plen_86_part_00
MLQGAENTYCASFCVERDQYLGVAGRGGWHDPDELLVGNTNCSCKSDLVLSCLVLYVPEATTSQLRNYDFHRECMPIGVGYLVSN